MSDVRVTRVLAPNPGVYTLDGTNTWVVGEGPALVIDPGPDDESHLRAVDAAAPGGIGIIALTHAHEDHDEGADRLASMTGAPVRRFAVADDELDVGGVRVQVLATPGHTPDHVVFRLPSTGAIFTGDLVLGRGTSVLDPPEGDLLAYLASLERLLSLEPKTLFPGHGPTIFAGRLKIQEYLDHRREREAQVLKALSSGEPTIQSMVADIYTGYPADVLPLAARSVLAHLEKLEQEGSVEAVHAAGATRYRRVGKHVCQRCGRPVRGKAALCPRCSMDALQEAPA